jgi:hypothetical protein
MVAGRPITVDDLLTFRAGYGFPSDFSLPAIAALFEHEECAQSRWMTDRMLPAGSLNHAMSGPPPRKMPFPSVSAGVPA